MIPTSYAIILTWPIPPIEYASPVHETLQYFYHVKSLKVYIAKHIFGCVIMTLPFFTSVKHELSLGSCTESSSHEDSLPLPHMYGDTHHTQLLNGENIIS